MLVSVIQTRLIKFLPTDDIGESVIQPMLRTLFLQTGIGWSVVQTMPKNSLPTDGYREIGHSNNALELLSLQTDLYQGLSVQEVVIAT